MSIELPKMPEPLCTVRLNSAGQPVDVAACGQDIDMWAYDTEEVYTADQLRAYGQEAARLALEAAAKAVADIEENPWYGYENPNTFQDAIHKAEAAILALGDKP